MILINKNDLKPILEKFVNDGKYNTKVELDFDEISTVYAALGHVTNTNYKDIYSILAEKIIKSPRISYVALEYIKDTFVLFKYGTRKFPLEMIINLYKQEEQSNVKTNIITSLSAKDYLYHIGTEYKEYFTACNWKNTRYQDILFFVYLVDKYIGF